MKENLKLNKLINFLIQKIRNFEYIRIWKFIKYYAVGIYDRVNDNNLLLFAAGLAFSLIICIMPFILLLISLLGNLLANESIRNQISSFIYTVIPYTNYADFVNNIISDRVQEIRNYKNVAGYIGLVGLFFAASGFFASLRTILNISYKVQESKHFLIGKLRDFGMILTLVFTFLVITMILPFGDALLNAIPRMAEYVPFLRADALQHLISVISSPFLMFILFYLFYYFIPYEKMQKRVAAVSAFWAAILWSLAESLFGYFLTNFAAYNKIYGTYVLLIVVIFWIYYSAIVFLLGAQIGQLYRERKEKVNNQEDDPVITET
ncbi:MAG: YihY/virulence factor BrkB family protein [Calditrichaceae bacterium]|jgi:membrane protein